MEHDFDPKLVAQYKALAGSGKKFFEAKQELVQAGWPEEQVNNLADEMPYEPAPTPTPVPPSPFENPNVDPAANAKVAAIMLDDQRRDAMIRTRAEIGAAGAGPDLESRLAYQGQALNDVGMSWWWYVGAFCLAIVLLFLKVNLHIVEGVVGGLLLLVFAWHYYRRYRRRS